MTYKKGQIPHNKIVTGEFCFIPYLCECKCNKIIPLEKKNISGYERDGYPKFIHGHNMIGISHSPSEIIKNQWSEKHKGQKAWNKGISLNKEHCKNLSLSHLHIFSALDRYVNPSYCRLFNNKLRESVRIRDSFICQNCGMTQKEHLLKIKKKLTCHHIHYLKSDCYPDLITLCNRCNTKANTNRSQWESFYMNKLNDRELLFWTKNRNIRNN
jgi:hypothetical protein